jgi:hypothetical protein
MLLINVGDNNGNYPIHLAIEGIQFREDNSETAIEMFQFLLDCDPDVVLQKYQDGQVEDRCQFVCEIFESHIISGFFGEYLHSCLRRDGGDEGCAIIKAYRYKYIIMLLIMSVFKFKCGGVDNDVWSKIDIHKHK